MNGKIPLADNVLRRKTDEAADADNGTAEAELTTAKEPEKAGRFQGVLDILPAVFACVNKKGWRTEWKSARNSSII